jgi:hypothetical protein
MYSKDIQKQLDIISARLSTDQGYTKRFFKDYGFASEESARLGLRMSPELHHVLYESYIRLNNAHPKLETFEKSWEKSNHKYNKRMDGGHSKVIAILAINTAVFGAITYVILKQFRKS